MVQMIKIMHKMQRGNTMKKMLCLAIAIIMMFSMTCTTYAAELPKSSSAKYIGKLSTENISIQECVEIEPCTTYTNGEAAAQYLGEISLDEFVGTCNSAIIPYALTRLTFSSLPAYEAVYSTAEYLINNEENDKLHIETCVWAPEEISITIGFWNLSSGKMYGVEFTGGAISSFNITTENVPSGRYYVYIKNNTGKIIDTGYLTYNII